MEYLIICSTSLIASGLTLFSGFGLGTILMPVFAVFFPVDAAVAMTAVVHFLNNLFKLALLGRSADRGVVLRFGLPAVAAAFLGAGTLVLLSGLAPLFSHHLLGRQFQVMPVKLVVALLMILFAAIELIPSFEKLSFNRRYLALGGLLSGFFGGLSGHQGALRSAFLIRCGLSREAFIATGVVIACLVDVSRISVYGADFLSDYGGNNIVLVAAAVLSAFLGAFMGDRLVKKVTLRTVQVIVSVMLFGIAFGLGAGII